MSEAVNTPDLAIRAKPKPVKRFSPKALILGGTALSAGLFAALAFALQSPEYGDSERPFDHEDGADLVWSRPRKA